MNFDINKILYDSLNNNIINSSNFLQLQQYSHGISNKYSALKLIGDNIRQAQQRNSNVLNQLQLQQELRNITRKSNAITRSQSDINRVTRRLRSMQRMEENINNNNGNLVYNLSMVIIHHYIYIQILIK